MAPETVVNLNQTAIAVLALCDGERTIHEVVEALAQRFEAPAGELRDDVAELLTRLSERGFVVLEPGP